VKLQAKTAIVTGSAREIGRSVALLSAKEGAKVAVVDIRPEEGNEKTDTAGKDSQTLRKLLMSNCSLPRMNPVL